MVQDIKPYSRGWRLLLANILLMVVVAFALIVITMKWVDGYTHHGEAVEVPNVVGKTLDEARSVFLSLNLECEVADSNYIKTEPAGAVLDCNPSAGQMVKKGRIVYLTVNTLSVPLQDIPDVADNSSLRQAEARLMAAGFRLDSIQHVEGEKDWVYGVKYNGRLLMSGEKVPEGATLQLMVGAGDDFQTDSLGGDSLHLAAPDGAQRQTTKTQDDDDSWF